MAWNNLYEVEEWLNKVKELDGLINAKLAERDQLMAIATKATASWDGMPHGSGVSDKVGNIAVKLVTLAEEADAAIDCYVKHRADVLDALSKLPEREYNALHRHYIRYMTWEDVAADMSYSRMQVWRIKQKGLKKLKDVMECYIIPVI